MYNIQYYTISYFMKNISIYYELNWYTHNNNAKPNVTNGLKVGYRSK